MSAGQPTNMSGYGQLRLNEVKFGDQVQVDNHFTCIEHWGEREVLQDEDGNLYITCSCGEHYLEGQLDKHGKLVGLRRKPND